MVEEVVAPRGNVTELALIKFMVKVDGGHVDEVKKAHIPENNLRYPFSSSRKCMTTEVKDSNGHSILLLKGASERIVACCS